MGQVYLARATGLGGFERQVVVKTLDLSITDDDDAFVTMFLDEARLVGSLHHQYIAPVYEVGCDDDGRYFLVMDYVHGETTEAVFRASTERHQPIPVAFSLTVASCVANALDYAHSMVAADGTPLDIVHRDISLTNVMVGHDGGVKLIDFGIAKAANRATRTQVGTLKGKIGYLAPEQVLRRAVDHRADIFALGIVIYELTTGARAFRVDSDLVTLERITAGEVTPPSEIVKNYPRELEAIVMRALELDPDDRFQDAGSLGFELETFAARHHLALGHQPVVEAMRRMFGDRARRRFARATTNDAQRRAAEVIRDSSSPAFERTLKPTVPLPPHGDDEEERSTLPIEVRNDATVPVEQPDELKKVDVGRYARPTTPPPGRYNARAVDMDRDRDSQPVRNPDAGLQREVPPRSRVRASTGPATPPPARVEQPALPTSTQWAVGSEPPRKPSIPAIPLREQRPEEAEWNLSSAAMTAETDLRTSRVSALTIDTRASAQTIDTRASDETLDENAAELTLDWAAASERPRPHTQPPPVVAPPRSAPQKVVSRHTPPSPHVIRREVTPTGPNVPRAPTASALRAPIVPRTFTPKPSHGRAPFGDDEDDDQATEVHPPSLAGPVSLPAAPVAQAPEAARPEYVPTGPRLSGMYLERDRAATRTWLMLCGLFAVAVVVAIILAMLK